MTGHLENRERLYNFLREELVGPSPVGEPVDISADLSFNSFAEFLRPRVQANGEEILQRESPTVRYGVGVLYPQRPPTEEDVTAETETEDEPNDAVMEPSAQQDAEVIGERARRDEDTEDDEFDVSEVNARRPSSLGISFLAKMVTGKKVRLAVAGGVYKEKAVRMKAQERLWWCRRAVRSEALVDCGDLMGDGERTVCLDWQDGSLKLAIWVLSRPYGPDKTVRLLTACVINRSTGSSDAHALFQVVLEASLDMGGAILPYPQTPGTRDAPEDEALALLYRHSDTYAVGHGCAADWTKEPDGRVLRVRSASLPALETPSISPSVLGKDGKEVRISMPVLAGLIEDVEPYGELESLCELYEAWLEEQYAKVETLGDRFKEPGRRNLAQCAEAARRMREGLSYLRTDPLAQRAFQLANLAVLFQQVRSAQERREATYDPGLKMFGFDKAAEQPSIGNPQAGRGYWRPFQMAFFLMCLRSTVDPTAEDRATVDLLWFPTGGGKTEAYLGLAAFGLFHRRLRDPGDRGVHILMRYTLRLLTTQQFQRAAGLICAMEHIRREHPGELGADAFGIGLWVGGGATPNTRKDALQALSDLNKGTRSAHNPFVLMRCPWCGAAMGRVRSHKTLPRTAPRILGYEQARGTVILKCPDHACEFSQGLPVYLVDEDIYEERPSLVIGTVDKFARLAWRPEARALFAIEKDGTRTKSPPGLIIQDELHLISGPLGSLDGLYEILVEELCTDHRGAVTRPKIICSTATIRRYAEQVRALYGRSQSALFPPPALDAADSFFARYATQENGDLAPGRLYLGVYGPGLRSLQTSQVRVLTSLLQGPAELGPAERDPWWTVLVFFNSLRELGTTLTLFQSDIVNRFKTLSQRLGLGPQQRRRIHSIKELTGRLRGEEIPDAIEQLKTSCTTDGLKPVDVCLASNIIEVGVDIDRLSLMVVAGQPKSTAQYIQVTGRIGRRWWERPGLVVTIYSPTKPRDRSHYEKFRSYHERLYAQVEPTSLTPFSLPVLERAIHALMVGYVRLAGDEREVQSPYPYPDELVSRIWSTIVERAEAVDPESLGLVTEILKKRQEEWQRWEPVYWASWVGRQDVRPLLHPAGSYVPPERRGLTWSTPTSMRNVDSECLAVITSRYIAAGGDHNA